jgi:hypothetical protein
MGLGMGLVMSPMSTAAMNAVEHTKAGVASGVLSMSRMVGGTFGVAVLGALVAALGKSKLADLLPNASPAARDRLAESLGAGGASAGGRTAEALNEAFVYALQYGLRLGAAVSLLGALVAWRLIAPRRAAAPQPALAGAPGEELAAAEAVEAA